MKKILTKINKYENRKKIYTGLIAGICFLFLLYGFGIAGTTLSIADAKSNNRQLTELQTQIAELEMEYFEIINTLTMEEVVTLGMEEQEDVLYAKIDQIKSIAFNNL